MNMMRTKQIVYVVMYGGWAEGCPHVIDSVWTSEKKAKKRVEELNSNKDEDDCDYEYDPQIIWK